jgi:hypothetical protein
VAATRMASATVLPLASPATVAANATTPQQEAITSQGRLSHARQAPGLDGAPVPPYDPAAPGRKHHWQRCSSWTTATGQGE